MPRVIKRICGSVRTPIIAGGLITDKEDVMAVFCDTLQEDGDLYRFLNDIENKFDLEIIRLSIGKHHLN